MPLFWYEDARIIDPEVQFDLDIHFYSRPSRVKSIMDAGIIIGVLLIFFGIAIYLNDRYYRNRFLKRVYID